MKKQILAGIIGSTLAYTALAQSNVTLYGLMDVGVGKERSNTPQAGTFKEYGLTSGGSSGSRIGVKAHEDLGNGSGAGAIIEYGFDASGSDPAFTNRKTVIYLENTYIGSRLNLGYQYTPMHDLLYNTSPSLGVNQVGDIFHEKISTGNQEGDTFIGNLYQVRAPGLRYTINPVGSDFYIDTFYGNQKSSNDFNTYHDKTVGLSVKFKDPNGFTGGYSYLKAPLAVDYGYVSIGPRPHTQAVHHVFSGQYTFDRITPSATFIHTSDKEGMQYNRWQIGARAQLTPQDAVYASYMDGHLHTPHLHAIDTHGYQLGYHHDVSKRTSAYMAVGFQGAKGPHVSNSKTEQYNIGLKHTF